ncbi:MAG TPA: maltose acetyltransferase domain-containing protein [Salinimicrobium sp.]|nr:maltose acetyltransferase domain-containing protein [Salinimicrobium sp.]
MMTEKQKMLSGELYDASDGQLVAERKHARIQLREFNSESEEEKEKRQQVLEELIPQAGNNLEIQPPLLL